MDENGATGARGARRATRPTRARAGRPATASPDPARLRRRRAGCVAGVLVIVALLAAIAGAVWWTVFRAESDVPPGRTVQIEIPAGSSSADVGQLLASRGVVANSVMFGFRARALEAASRLKPGVYDLTTGSDYDLVIRVLEAGPTIVYHTVAVPEGWTIDQIAARVEEKTGIPASEFSKLADTGSKSFDFPFLASNPTGSLQGYLFPKTYRVREGSTADDVIRMMLVQYGKETGSVDLSYSRSRGLNDRDVLIIASMIEREASRDKDRPVVASVIYNRLKKGMRLELCATVQFVLGNKPTLTIADTKVDSPYNTYLHKGLPPGPISNPGLASIKAAAAPASTKYLYYVLTHKDGSHSFAATYEEFLRLKARAEKGLQ